MRIALLHYAAQPIIGGVESVIGHHAKLMTDAGHQVRIVAGRGEQVDPLIEFFRIPILDSRHAGVLEIKAELDSGKVPEVFDKYVVQLASELQPAITNMDVVIAHNICSLNKNLILTAGINKLHKERVIKHLILWHHDLAWTTSRYRPELHDGYPWDLLRTDWPGVINVTISESRQSELAGLLGIPHSQIALIPNGIDIARFLKLEPQTIEFVKQLSLLASSPLLLLPVRITPRKNIEFGLRILAALRKYFPHPSLVVTGPLGAHNPANINYFKRLLALRKDLGVADCAVFIAELTPEFLPDEVIADFYRIADGLLLPSLEEGFGLPLIEAGLTGLPVFCSDIEPLRKLGGEDALYFSLDTDPDQVAKLIRNYFASNLPFELRLRVRNQYTWEGVYLEKIAPLLQTWSNDEN